MDVKYAERGMVGDRWRRWLITGGLLLNAAGWVGALRFVPRAQAVIPLHYTIYFGINLTGAWTSILWLPAIGAAALVSHLLISRLVPHPVWSRLWLLLAVVINLLALIDLAVVIVLMRTYNT
ncbi:MAG: hypothetical protein AAB619_02110 [Patescibacteria group bacterium]